MSVGRWRRPNSGEFGYTGEFGYSTFSHGCEVLAVADDTDLPSTPEEPTGDNPGDANGNGAGNGEGRLVTLSIEDELKDSYLTYAMSVIVSRALPDVRDGLKPSPRRILVAMNDLNP